jgi:O-antigen/teichoic acid export membrane protein
MLASVACNALGNAILIPRLGIVGAAVATGTSFLASAALTRIVAARIAGVRF